MLFKKRVSFVCVFLMLLGLHLQAQRHQTKAQIYFMQPNFRAALKLSKQHHKPVFVDAYAVWCAPCKQLKYETFRDKKVATYFNSHFINISVDVERGENEKFAELYEVNSYPTLLFIDENGSVINKTEGFIDAKSLLTLAAKLNK